MTCVGPDHVSSNGTDPALDMGPVKDLDMAR